MIPPPVGGGAQRAYVYLLRSRKEGTFYIGWTTDPVRRLIEHNDGQHYFTRRKIPWQLIGFEMFHSIDAAKRRERALKHNPRMQMLFKKRLLNRAAVGSPRQVVRMIPPPADRSGNAVMRESRCGRGGSAEFTTNHETRRAARPRTGHQQVVG